MVTILIFIFHQNIRKTRAFKAELHSLPTPDTKRHFRTSLPSENGEISTTKNKKIKKLKTGLMTENFAINIPDPIPFMLWKCHCFVTYPGRATLLSYI